MGLSERLMWAFCLSLSVLAHLSLLHLVLLFLFFHPSFFSLPVPLLLRVPVPWFSCFPFLFLFHIYREFGWKIQIVMSTVKFLLSLTSVSHHLTILPFRSLLFLTVHPSPFAFPFLLRSHSAFPLIPLPRSLSQKRKKGGFFLRRETVDNVQKYTMKLTWRKNSLTLSFLFPSFSLCLSFSPLRAFFCPPFFVSSSPFSLHSSSCFSLSPSLPRIVRTQKEERRRRKTVRHETIIMKIVNSQRKQCTDMYWHKKGRWIGQEKKGRRLMVYMKWNDLIPTWLNKTIVTTQTITDLKKAKRRSNQAGHEHVRTQRKSERKERKLAKHSEHSRKMTRKHGKRIRE